VAANLGEFEVTITGDVAVLQLQGYCGAAFDLGVKEWQIEQSAVAFDRLLSGVDGKLDLQEAVRHAIGESLIERAIAVLIGSKRELLFCNGDRHCLAELARCEAINVQWTGIRFTDDRGQAIRIFAEGQVLEPSQSRLRNPETWRDTAYHRANPNRLEVSLCNIESFPAHDFYLTTDRGRVTCRRCLDLIERAAWSNPDSANDGFPFTCQHSDHEALFFTSQEALNEHLLVRHPRVERCTKCGIRSVNGERKTIGCMPGRGEHDYQPA
jgi:hypothetical protein